MVYLQFPSGCTASLPPVLSSPSAHIVPLPARSRRQWGSTAATSVLLPASAVAVECSLLMNCPLESGTPRTSHTLPQFLRVPNALEIFSAVRLGSVENRGGRNW